MDSSRYITERAAAALAGVEYHALRRARLRAEKGENAPGIPHPPAHRPDLSADRVYYLREEIHEWIMLREQVRRNGDSAKRKRRAEANRLLDLAAAGEGE